MSYTNLFKSSSANLAAAAAASTLDTESQYAEQLLANLESLGYEQEELSRQGDMVEALLNAFEANANSTGAANVVFSMINHMSNGAAESVTGCSMEDFSMEALDGLKGAVSAAYDAVIKMIEDLMRNVKSFLGELFDKFPRLKTSAEKLRAKAEKTEGSIKDKKIKIGGAHRMLCGGDKKITGLAASLKVVNTLRKESGVDQYAGWIKDSRIEDFEGDKDAIAALTNAGMNADAPVTKCSLPALGNGVPPEAIKDLVGKACYNLPGDKVFAVAQPKPDKNLSDFEKTLKRIASTRAGFYDQSTKKLDVNDVETETLTSDEVVKVCEAVEEICETYAKSKVEIKEGLKQQERIVKILKKVKANVDKKDFADVKPRLNLIKNAVSNIAKLATQPSQKLSAYAYSVASASLSYGEKSLAQYKKD